VLDGLTLDAENAVTFGNAGTDTLTISTALVTVDTSSANAGAGALVDVNAATTLNAPLTITTGAAGITLDGTVDGNQALVLNTTGTTDINADIGTTTTAIASLTTNAGGTTELGADISAQGGTILFNDPVVLTSATTLTDTGGTGLTFADTVTGNFDLTLAISGATEFQGAVGGADGTTAIGDGFGAAITINSAGTTGFQGTVRTASGISQADTAGTVTFRDNVTVAAGDTASTFDGNIVLDGLTFDAENAVAFGSAVTDTLTISTALVTVDTSSANAGAGALVDVNAATTLNAPLIITTGGAGIQFDSTIGTGGNNLTLDAGSTGNITLSDALTGGGNFVVVDGAVQSYSALSVNSLDIQDATTSVTFNNNVASTTTIDVVSGGSIVQTGDVTGATDLVYNAGSSISQTGSISGVASVDMDAVTTADLSAIEATGQVDVTAGTINVGGLIETTGTGGDIGLHGDTVLSAGITTNGESITLDGGNVTVAAAVALTTGIGPGDINISGNVDATAAAVPKSLDLTAGLGAVTFASTVGTSAPLALQSLTISSASQVDLANIDNTGSLSITASNIDLNGTSYNSTGEATFDGDVDLMAGGNTITIRSGSGNDITVTGNIEDIGSDDTLALDAGTSGSIDLQGTVGAFNPLAGFSAINNAGFGFTSVTSSGAIDIVSSGTIDADGLVTTGGGDTDDISVQGSSIEVAIITAGGDADVSLTATSGGITDADANSQITADDLTFSATAGVGTSAERINTTIAELVSGSSTGAGGIFLNETNSVELTNVSNTNGPIDIQAAGLMTARNVVTSGGGDLDDITLAGTRMEVDTVSAGGIGDVSLSVIIGEIDDVDGNSSITADDLSFSAVTSVGGSNAINIAVNEIVSGQSGGVGDINLNETNDVQVTSLSNASGAISLTAGGLVTVGSISSTGGADTHDIVIQGASIEVDTINAVGVADVSLTADTSGIDDTDSNSSITGDDLTFSAVTSVGGTNAINTTVNEIVSGQSTGVGGIHLNETDDIVLASVINSNGLIDITAGSAMTAVNVSTTGTADTDDIALNAQNLEVGSISAAGDGDILLTAGIAISDANADSSVIADQLSFTSAGAVGASSQRINTTVTDIFSGSSSGAGGIYLNETNDAVLISVSNSSGVIDINAGGGHDGCQCVRHRRNGHR